MAFERFTRSARQTVITAQAEARRLGARQIGSEHLLLALTLGPEAGPARATLAEFGLDHAGAEARLLEISGTKGLDADALSTVGIDLDEVRRRVEAQFGPGALDAPEDTKKEHRFPFGGGLPFGSDAKSALETALREAIALGDRELGSAHILLGLLGAARGLSGPGLGVRILRARGIEPGVLRSRLVDRLRASA